MKKKAIHILSLFIIISFLFIISTTKANAADLICADFNDNNSRTDWQTIHRFGYDYRNAAGTVVHSEPWPNRLTWSRDGSDCIIIARPNNWIRYFVHWSTSCIDPVQRIGQSGSFDFLGEITIDDFSKNIDVTYRAGSTPGDNLGQVPYNGTTGTSYTNTTCPQCRSGQTRDPYCGDGANRCDRLQSTCNNNGLWVTTVINNNASGCVGSNGCCLADSNCSGGNAFCGAGDFRCDRRRNFCNNAKQCAVETTERSAPRCNGENKCCQNDSHCGSNQYCKNPPNGECTTWAQIGGRVFTDVNSNDSYDSGLDIPIPNIRVDRRNASAANWQATDITGGGGRYLFDGRANPSNHDIRVQNNQFDFTCQFENGIRPSNIQNNITATPTLNNINFMLRPQFWPIAGTVWRDANYSGRIDAGDVRANNCNIKIRTNDADGNKIGDDNTACGNAATNGNYWINRHVHGQTYTVTLVLGSLPPDRYIVGSNKRYPTINCAANRNNDFLITDTPKVRQPDLDISYFSFPGGYINSGVTATLRIENTGDAWTGGDFNLDVHNGAGNVQTIRVGAIPAGGEQWVNVNNSIPGTAGDWTADAFVDSSGEIAEYDEGNNRSRTNFTAVGPTYDLVIDAFTVPDGEIRTTSSGTVVVRNAGSDPTPSGFSISIDNGTGAFVSVGAPALGAGESTAVGFTITIPGTVSPYTATAMVDSTYLIPESDETNNTASTIYNATYTPPTYSIRGGVFIDSVDSLQQSDGIKQAGEPYVGGALGTLNISTYGDVNTAGFNIPGFLEGDYTITYYLSNLPAGWESTYPYPPASLTNPSVVVHPGDPDPVSGSCSMGTHRWASCAGDGSIIGVDFGIRQRPADPWFNGIGGDMRSDNPLVNRIPNAAGDWFSDTNASLQTGGVVFGQFVLNPLTGESPRISKNQNWIVGNNFSGKINFSFSGMQNLLSKNGVWSSASSLSGICNTASCTLPAGLASGIYTSADLTLTGGNYTFPADVDVIFMINGDLTIENNITIPAGSTVMFIVSGSITVAPNVTEIHGIFSAGDTFTVEGANLFTPDERLIIQGSIIGNAKKLPSVTTFANNRNLFNGNETTPVVQIIYRPDFVLNAPAYLKSQNYIIKEVAPGSK